MSDETLRLRVLALAADDDTLSELKGAKIELDDARRLLVRVADTLDPEPPRGDSPEERAAEICRFMARDQERRCAHARARELRDAAALVLALAERVRQLEGTGLTDTQ